MILEKLKTASVPAQSELGRNEPAIQLLVWRFTQRNGKRYRVASCLGEFSVWEEGDAERQVFRINLGILEEVTRRYRAARLRAVLELREGIRELEKKEVREIWRRCTTDTELRFCVTTRQNPAKLGDGASVWTSRRSFWRESAKECLGVKRRRSWLRKSSKTTTPPRTASQAVSGRFFFGAIAP